jgi:hypothetical protein
MRKIIYVILMLQSINSFANKTIESNSKFVKEQKKETVKEQKKETVKFVGSCTASAGCESVTYSNPKLSNEECCKRAVKLLYLSML